MDARLGEDEAQPLVLDVVEADRLAANDTSSRVPDGLLFGGEVQDRLGRFSSRILPMHRALYALQWNAKFSLGESFATSASARDAT